MSGLPRALSRRLKDIAKLSIKEGPVAKPEPLAVALARDLAERAVSDIVRKYGGSWSSDRRMFIVPGPRGA